MAEKGSACSYLYESVLNMKKLKISFSDTDEKAIIGEDSLVIAIGNKNMSSQSECFILEVDENLPNILTKKPLMFYIYDDLPVLKLYRSAYISGYEWIA